VGAGQVRRPNVPAAPAQGAGISILDTGAVTPGDNGLIFTSRGRRTAIGIGAAVVIAAGIVLVIIKATSTKIGPEVPFGIGGLLIIGGFAIGGVVLRPRGPRQRREVRMSQETISRAADLRTRAEFTETYARSSQLGISGSGLSLSATGGTQLARIPLNEVDVVREFYALVQKRGSRRLPGRHRHRRTGQDAGRHRGDNIPEPHQGALPHP
jgi:hypothetical protein